MFYLDFLYALHRRLDPPSYMEIGIRNGDSLSLARTTSVGIDPAYDVRVELPYDPVLFRETSDEYFDRPDPLAPLGGRRVALSFIDGLHLAEFALRDFINVERQTDWTSVIVFDDMLPRDVTEAARERETREWTGDVYKVMVALAEHRPDLICLRIDTEPTGLLLVLGLDPESTALDDAYDEIQRDSVVPDPQDVPDDVLRREGALDPDAVLDARFWKVLRRAREKGTPRETGLPRLRRAIGRDFPAFRPPGRRLPGLPARA